MAQLDRVLQSHVLAENLTPKSPLLLRARNPIYFNVSLDSTSVPAKWNLTLSNGLSRVHECDRWQTDHAIEKRVGTGVIACAAISDSGWQLMATYSAAILFDECQLGLISAFALLLLLNAWDDSPRGTSSADDVLVRDWQQVTFLDSQLNIQRRHALHALHHF